MTNPNRIGSLGGVGEFIAGSEQKSKEIIIKIHRLETTCVTQTRRKTQASSILSLASVNAG